MLLLSASLAAAQDAPTAPSTSAPAALESARQLPSGWVKRGSSLLFYEADGSLSSEIGLRSSEDGDARKWTVTTLRGDASPNGRFAWVLERVESYQRDGGRDHREGRRRLRVLGSSGKELWESGDGDLLEGVSPVLFSEDGEILLVLLRDGRGWRAEVRSYVGATLISVGPLPKVLATQLTGNGRYAMIRWNVPDESATHTFLEIPSRRRLDLPSGGLHLGAARLEQDGKVYSGSKLVVDLSRPAEKAP